MGSQDFRDIQDSQDEGNLGDLVEDSLGGQGSQVGLDDALDTDDS
jgi:hypothetical protein